MPNAPLFPDKPYPNERKQIEACLDLIRHFRRLDPELQAWALQRLREETTHAVPSLE